jgi:hypothetical protein
LFGAEVKGCLLASKSEESLSDFKCDIENEPGDYTLLDVMDDIIDEDDNGFKILCGRTRITTRDKEKFHT